MNKFFKVLVKFILFTAVFYSILLLLWGKYSPRQENLKYVLGGSGFSYTRLKEVKNTRNVDILFLGSSHTYHGFDTRIFEKEGFSSFNLGTNSQTPVQTEFFLNKYLDSLNPKIVIFDVCPSEFSGKGVESSLDIISNEEMDGESISLAFNQNHLIVFNTLIYSFLRNLIFLDRKKYNENKLKNEYTYIEGGYVEKELQFYEQRDFGKTEWIKKNRNMESFRRIIKILSDRNIELILVQTPVTSDLYNSFTNNSEFDKEMSNYGRYYNFNELLDLNDTLHFFDYHHLNQNGTEIFNERMINEIEKTDNY